MQHEQVHPEPPRPDLAVTRLADATRVLERHANCGEGFVQPVGIEQTVTYHAAVGNLDFDQAGMLAQCDTAAEVIQSGQHPAL